jgi:ADP-ribosyl-[dinitrogen reductase] hydrolase
MPDFNSRIMGGIWGVLVADAMGLPHQFKVSAHIPQQLDMRMPQSYAKAFRGVDYGAWSDDGALTLALTDTLTKQGKLDLDHFGRNVVNWFDKGYFTVDGKSYDVGNTTLEAVLRLQRGHPPEASGLDQESANGNGSLMRTLPLALWHQGTDQELYKDACAQSAVTHRHDIAQAACGVYCVAARHILNGATSTRGFIEGLKLAHVQLDIPKTPKGSGFVLDTLAFAIAAARSSRSYEDVVLTAIRLGADTDTTAAVAGGLIGVRDGREAIPFKWFKQMRGYDKAEDLVQGFLKARIAATKT